MLGNCSELKRISLMGTSPEDWEIVSELSTSFPEHIVPCFGLHPWYVYKLHKSYGSSGAAFNESNWKQTLKTYLDKHKNSIVGEFGLDKSAKTPSSDMKQYPELPLRTFDSMQLDVFDYHFNLATELRRPVSVHSVHSHGALFEYLKSRLVDSKSKFNASDDIKSNFPPAIMLHSYTGSIEFMRQILRLPVVGTLIYFSVSDVINTNYGKTECFKEIPESRLLIESDLSDPTKLEQMMDNILTSLSKHRNKEKEILSEIIWENSLRFYGDYSN